MMPSINSNSELRNAFRTIADCAEHYFANAATLVTSQEEDMFGWAPIPSIDFYWDQLPVEVKDVAEKLIARVLHTSAELAGHTKSSLISGPEDTRDIKLAAKRMRSALTLRKYHYREADVIHDEGSVLGYRSAEQTDLTGLSPEQAQKEFKACLQTISSVVTVIEATPPSQFSIGEVPSPEVSKYKSDTAFIMMWMDPSHHELTDVADSVRTVFRSFGVNAVRADDIEHDGLITERILNEIRTSEFLFADLTGARPNVYYEIGFAHALGKKVILFRKSGTGIHFDLAGYNCPEYENLRDLKEKLTKRLVSVTNKNPNEAKEI
jgi:hypothetical protein